jgi:hypothetical protein
MPAITHKILNAPEAHTAVIGPRINAQLFEM